MRGRSYVLLLLGVLVLPGALCDGEDREYGRDLMIKKPVGNVWSEPKEVAIGESFFIYCNTTNFEIQPGDLTLKLDSGDVVHDMVPVNNSTVRYREEFLRNDMNKCYTCFLKEAKIERHCITTTFLNVSNFECMLLVFSMSMSCKLYITEFDISAKYTITDSGQQPVKCWPSLRDHKWMMKCDIAIDYKKETYAFTLLKKLKARKLIQHLQLRRHEIMEPEWESMGNRTCLPAPKVFKTKECRIHLVPQSAQIGRHDLTLIDEPALSGQLFCFDSPRHAHQKFEVHLRCSLSNPPGAQSTEFVQYDYLTPPAKPDRPPELLPNGFFHDFENKKLYVYWRRLDELELNGPNFTYSGQANSAQQAHLLDNNSAYFVNWDPKLPNTVFVWSENSKGQSEYTSTLKIPVLTNSSSHQPQELTYQVDTFTFFWQPPKNRDNLIGYTVFWCPMSNKNLEFCDDREPIKFQTLRGSTVNQFKFNRTMTMYRKAVAANYNDNRSGGMQWIGVAPFRNKEPEKKVSNWFFIISITMCFFFGILAALAILKKRRNIS